jgi:hypothetical protein
MSHYELGKQTALVKLGFVKAAGLQPSTRVMLSEIAHGAVPGLAAGAGTYAATDDPMLAAGAGLGVGSLGYGTKLMLNHPRKRDLDFVSRMHRNTRQGLDDINGKIRAGADPAMYDGVKKIKETQLKRDKEEMDRLQSKLQGLL